mmetsp:Transcript_12695/g.53200  ORF Transcript_12695/g.53200 Transcript_12695/m.53200 type:complete len:298 (-) Transcript_12695:111-1004(-)
MSTTLPPTPPLFSPSARTRLWRWRASSRTRSCLSPACGRFRFPRTTRRVGDRAGWRSTSPRATGTRRRRLWFRCGSPTCLRRFAAPSPRSSPRSPAATCAASPRCSRSRSGCASTCPPFWRSTARWTRPPPRAKRRRRRRRRRGAKRRRRRRRRTRAGFSRGTPSSSARSPRSRLNARLSARRRTARGSAARRICASSSTRRATRRRGRGTTKRTTRKRGTRWKKRKKAARTRTGTAPRRKTLGPQTRWKKKKSAAAFLTSPRRVPLHETKPNPAWTRVSTAGKPSICAASPRRARR